MLIITHPNRPIRRLVEAMRGQRWPVFNLSYWEQIGSFYADGAGGTQIELLGNDLRDQLIWFLEYPVFHTPPNIEDLEFAASEWQASLASLLWLRRRQVVNGHLLIKWPSVQGVAKIFSQSIRRAGLWYLGGQEPRSPEDIWLLRCGGITDIWPAELIAPRESTLERLGVIADDLLRNHRLDYIAFRLRRTPDGLAVESSHLTPCPDFPISMLVTIAAFKLGNRH